MLDLRAIRENPEPYRAALARRGAADDLDRALELDEQRRKLIARVEDLRAEQNRGSKVVRDASADERQRMIQSLRGVSEELKEIEPDLARAEEELRRLAEQLPNIPDPTAPDGLTDEDNVEIRRWGEPPRFDFEAKDHVE